MGDKKFCDVIKKDRITSFCAGTMPLPHNQLFYKDKQLKVMKTGEVRKNDFVYVFLQNRFYSIVAVNRDRRSTTLGFAKYQRLVDEVRSLFGRKTSVARCCVDKYGYNQQDCDS
jgi:hypothetical protein